MQTRIILATPFLPITGLFLATILGLLIGILPVPAIVAGFGIIILAIMIQSPLIPLIAMLVLAPLRTLIATESPLQLPLDIGQLMLAGFLFSWLLYRITHQQPILKIKPSSVFFAILFALCGFALNAWTANSLNAWLTEWLKWLIMAILMWLVLISERQNWQWLLYALLTAAIANALVGLYIFLGGSGADHLVIGGRFFRAFGTFGQPNPFGGFMGITLPLAIMGLYSQVEIIWKKSRTKQPIPSEILIKLSFFTFGSGLIFAALIASWSRGAWLGFIVSMAIVVFSIPRRTKISLSVFIVTIFTLIVLWFTGILPQSIVDRLATSATDFITIEDIRGVDITTINYAVVERLAHWQAAVNMAEAHPLTGVGLGSYELVYNQYRLINWKEPLGHAHNYYLNILAEAGIIGIFTYLTFWLAIIYFTWKTRQHPNKFTRLIAIGLLGSWTYIAVHSLFDNLYVNNLFLHIGILLGISAILHQQVWQSTNLE